MSIKKRFGLVLALLVVGATVMAQDYVVIHVKGQITREKTGAAIKRGDKINAEERISFSSPQSVAAILSSDRGRFILKSGSDTPADGDLFYIFKAAVQPMRGRMSTRAGGINNALDFQKQFEGTTAFLGEELRVKVSDTSFPQDDNNFFYIRYTYKGEAINKKLPANTSYLVINKEELLKVDSNPVAFDQTSGYELFHYQADQQNSTRITELNFAMVELEEFKTLVSAMESSDLEVNEQSVGDMITDIYGKLVPGHLSDAMKAAGM